MIDEAFKKLVDDLYNSEIFNRNEIFTTQIRHKNGQLSKNGQLHSSAAIISLGELFSNEAEIRVLIYYQIIMKIAGTIRVKINEEFKIKASILIRENADKEIAMLNENLTKQPSMKDMNNSFPFSLVQSKAYNQVQKSEAEIQLALMAAQSPQEITAPVFNINGNGIVVQTGANSVSNFVQYISQNDKVAISSALKMLKQEIEKLTINHHGYSKDDIVESIDLAVDQLDKEKPNFGIVKSILSNISSTVSFIGDLQPAWAAVKAAAVSVTGLLM